MPCAARICGDLCTCVPVHLCTRVPAYRPDLCLNLAPEQQVWVVGWARPWAGWRDCFGRNPASRSGRSDRRPSPHRPGGVTGRGVGMGAATDRRCTPVTLSGAGSPSPPPPADGGRDWKEGGKGMGQAWLPFVMTSPVALSRSRSVPAKDKREGRWTAVAERGQGWAPVHVALPPHPLPTANSEVAVA